MEQRSADGMHRHISHQILKDDITSRVFFAPEKNLREVRQSPHPPDHARTRYCAIPTRAVRLPDYNV